MICTIEDCNRKLRCKGLCDSHYRQQWQRVKKVLPCSVESCEVSVRSKGLCPKHYQHYYHTKRAVVLCKAPECISSDYVIGYCKLHYHRLKTHGSLDLPVKSRGNGIRLPLINTQDGLKARSLVPEYNTWTAMKNRCYNPKDPRYDRYVGRGIVVCEEWREDFQAFYDYIGTRPTSKHTINRINNNKNYEPGNVEWATVREQNKNRSNSRPITGVGSYLDRNNKTVRWYASLKIGKKWMLHRTFKTEEEAIEARKEAEEKYLNNVTLNTRHERNV